MPVYDVKLPLIAEITIRTGDKFLTRELLCQLSYKGIFGAD
jgi:hypothetical protein